MTGNRHARPKVANSLILVLLSWGGDFGQVHKMIPVHMYIYIYELHIHTCTCVYVSICFQITSCPLLNEALSSAILAVAPTYIYTKSPLTKPLKQQNLLSGLYTGL